MRFDFDPENLIGCALGGVLIALSLLILAGAGLLLKLIFTLEIAQ